MAATTQPRPTTTITLSLLAVVLAGTLAACGKGGSTPPAGPSGEPELGAAPTPSATAMAVASPTKTGDGSGTGTGTGSGSGSGNGGGGGTGGGGYPADAKGYALALLKAWTAKNYSRIDQLAESSAVQQIKDSIKYGGVPNGNWHYVKCDGAAGSSYCTFRNDNGDQTVIRLRNTQLGHPTAVTEAPLERTEYPSTASDYVSRFIDAWRDGNTYRMAAFASSSIATSVAAKPAPNGVTMGEDAQVGDLVPVSATNLGGFGQYYQVKVGQLGKAHAIVKVCNSPC